MLKIYTQKLPHRTRRIEVLSNLKMVRTREKTHKQTERAGFLRALKKIQLRTEKVFNREY